MSVTTKRLANSGLSHAKWLEALVGERNAELKACKMKINRIERALTGALEILATYSEWQRALDDKELYEAQTRALRRKKLSTSAKNSG